ncbi:nitroreductase/quinone reductase family protein [Actinoplanes sp. NEAU-A12]|uniref:Nitroreductase/quinone reductase family protein n=1 Tax=Actinoplanes sandaracinus TaxID=3045177 RepID=A0ABT6WVH5_9ACTN|nr:nitroreductase/quinone reductase family protein [Actinoplanes sandaracinus]MDI6103725.1 nitroreductase/quinone reductase family protein [Actinoplanes sandaracinus]
MTDAGFDFNAFQRHVIEEFRANEGRVGGPFSGADLVLLTTIGARTGKERTSPLGVLVIDGTPVVVASAMGADKHPDWFHNIRRNPVVTVETGTETYQAVAAAPDGADRDALFARVVALEPGFGDYQDKTTRRIPVVTLTRIDDGRAAWARGLGDFLVEAHDWLRAELAGLRRQVDDLIAGGDEPLHAGRPGLGHEMRTHCLEFCAALKLHHTGEDRGGFPMLAHRFPGLAPVLERLAEEHVVVARLQERLRALVDSYEPGRTDLARLRSDLEDLATRLEEHFQYEERTVVSALNTLGPAPDFS